MRAALIILILFISLALVGALFRTYLVQGSATQKAFLAGKLPETTVKGRFSGTAEFFQGAWNGKIFDGNTSTGINMYKNELTLEEEQRYPFRTYTGKGLQEKNRDVMKLDYDVPENSWWMRLVMDEIVEVEEDIFVGKTHIRLIPNLPFTVGFFRIVKVVDQR